MSNNHINKVAIVGVSYPLCILPNPLRDPSCTIELNHGQASGHIGSHIVTELLNTGRIQITAISRKDSTSKFQEGVKVAPVDYSKEETIVEALRGHDFLIISLGTSAAPEVHSSLCSAAVKAGIHWIMPNAYGMGE